MAGSWRRSTTRPTCRRRPPSTSRSSDDAARHRPPVGPRGPGKESGPGRRTCRGRVQTEGTCEIRDVVEVLLAGQNPSLNQDAAGSIGAAHPFACLAFPTASKMSMPPAGAGSHLSAAFPRPTEGASAQVRSGARCCEFWTRARADRIRAPTGRDGHVPTRSAAQEDPAPRAPSRPRPGLHGGRAQRATRSAFADSSGSTRRRTSEAASMHAARSAAGAGVDAVPGERGEVALSVDRRRRLARQHADPAARPRPARRGRRTRAARPARGGTRSPRPCRRATRRRSRARASSRTRSRGGRRDPRPRGSSSGSTSGPKRGSRRARRPAPGRCARRASRRTPASASRSGQPPSRNSSPPSLNRIETRAPQADAPSASARSDSAPAAEVRAATITRTAERSSARAGLGGDTADGFTSGEGSRTRPVDRDSAPTPAPRPDVVPSARAGWFARVHLISAGRDGLRGSGSPAGP